MCVSESVLRRRNCPLWCSERTLIPRGAFWHFSSTGVCNVFIQWRRAGETRGDGGADGNQDRRRNVLIQRSGGKLYDQPPLQPCPRDQGEGKSEYANTQYEPHTLLLWAWILQELLSESLTISTNNTFCWGFRVSSYMTWTSKQTVHGRGNIGNCANPAWKVYS